MQCDLESTLSNAKPTPLIPFRNAALQVLLLSLEI